jgi:hypothetical protein
MIHDMSGMEKTVDSSQRVLTSYIGYLRFGVKHHRAAKYRLSGLTFQWEMLFFNNTQRILDRLCIFYYNFRLADKKGGDHGNSEAHH